MKKIIVGVCLVFVLMGSFVMADNSDSWLFGVKAESQETMLKWQSANLMDYADIKPMYAYKYRLDVGAMKGKTSLQGFSLQLGKTFLKKKVKLLGGFGLAKVNMDLDRPEYTTESSFKTNQGYDSQDREICLGESVKSNGTYKPYWFVSAKANLLEKKGWKLGIEGKYLSFSDSGFSLPLQSISNDWRGANMEFSIKGNSMKIQQAEGKFFGSLKVSEKLEVSGAAGYLWSKARISGESIYKYSQDLTNVNFNQKWKLTGKPETATFAEASVMAMLTKNLKIIVSGNVGAKKGFSVGISYSFGGNKAPTPRVIKTTPKKEGAKKVVTEKKAVSSKEEAKKSTLKTKKTVAPKEGAKKVAGTTLKKNVPQKEGAKNSYSCLLKWTARLLGLTPPEDKK
jgi:hypothetical protein